MASVSQGAGRAPIGVGRSTGVGKHIAGLHASLCASEVPPGHRDQGAAGSLGPGVIKQLRCCFRELGYEQGF